MRQVFGTLQSILLLCIIATSAIAQNVDRHTTAMGFTPWPVDFTLAGTERTYAFIHEHSNLIAHHFDGGIPWEAAASGGIFPDHLNNDWATRRAMSPDGAKVFVAVTPLNFERDGLAPAWTNRGDNQRLPRRWRNASLSDPHVIEVYENYVRRVVEYFDPDFLAIGIEANVIISNAPNLWNDYAALNAAVYSALKPDYPDLPIFATVQYEHLRGIEADSHKFLEYQMPAVVTLMQSSDILALSTYRYGTVHPNPMSPNYFDIAKLFGKPIAIAESGAMSQRTEIFGMELPASTADQSAFVAGLMQHATQNRFPFVVNWVAIDFDPGLNRLPRSVREIAKAWVHAGLETSDGQAKPALEVWDRYLANSRP